MARSSVIRTEEEEASLASENKEERGRAPLSAIFFSPFPFFFSVHMQSRENWNHASATAGCSSVLSRATSPAAMRCGAVRC
jgi:hypothetical protein